MIFSKPSYGILISFHYVLLRGEQFLTFRRVLLSFKTSAN